MRARIKKARPELSKGLMQSDIRNNTQKEKLKRYSHSYTICSYRKSNINTSVSMCRNV